MSDFKRQAADRLREIANEIEADGMETFCFEIRRDLMTNNVEVRINYGPKRPDPPTSCAGLGS